MALQQVMLRCALRLGRTQKRSTREGMKLSCMVHVKRCYDSKVTCLELRCEASLVANVFLVVTEKARLGKH